MNEVYFKYYIQSRVQVSLGPILHVVSF